MFLLKTMQSRILVQQKTMVTVTPCKHWGQPFWTVFEFSYKRTRTFTFRHLMNVTWSIIKTKLGGWMFTLLSFNLRNRTS